jgi:DNA-binding transcriptional ArsR family regulator
MNEGTDGQFVDVLAALASEPRLKLLRLLHGKTLACGDPGRCDVSARCCNVSELAAGVGLSLATTSHHLKELRRAGLIRTERRGRFIYCSIETEAMRTLGRFFGQIADDCEPAPAATEDPAVAATITRR